MLEQILIQSNLMKTKIVANGVFEPVNFMNGVGHDTQMGPKSDLINMGRCLSDLNII